jgi:hypothetical protein
VGGYRAAQFIAQWYRQEPPPVDEFLRKIESNLEKKIELLDWLVDHKEEGSTSINKIKEEIQEIMEAYGGLVRSLEGIRAALHKAYILRDQLEQRLVISSRQELLSAMRLMDLVTTCLVYLEAIRAYLEKGGGSRGSYIILDPHGKQPSEKLGPEWRYKPFDKSLMDKVCEVWLDENIKINVEWINVRPIPTQEAWFEKVWQEYRKGKIYRCNS